MKTKEETHHQSKINRMFFWITVMLSVQEMKNKMTNQNESKQQAHG